MKLDVFIEKQPITQTVLDTFSQSYRLLKKLERTGKH
jgi:hypothetical protein